MAARLILERLASAWELRKGEKSIPGKHNKLGEFTTFLETANLIFLSDLSVTRLNGE